MLAAMRHRLTGLTVAVIVLLAAWGCGGSDDVAGTVGPGSGTPAATAPTDEVQINDVADRFYGAYVGGDGAAACALLSAAARRQVVEDPDTAGDGTTCDARLTAAAKVIAQYYGPDPEVSLAQVTVSGDRATGVITIGGRSQSVAFEREDGGWKLGPEPGESP